MIPLLFSSRPSEFAYSFAQHIHELHDKVHKQIALNNASCKETVDVRSSIQEFNEGDFVMIRVQLERYPRGTISKIMAHRTRPYHILKKI